jgi:hypothetical protein
MQQQTISGFAAGFWYGGFSPSVKFLSVRVLIVF